MVFKVIFIPDKEYYAEAYGEIISSLKYKKLEPFFAVLMIMLGIILYFQDTFSAAGIIPILFSVIGLYELIKLYYEKKNWIKVRMDSKVQGQPIEMEFTNETIKHTGPFSQGELKWSGLKQIIKTKQGILIKPENGISIYLSNKVFANKEQVEFILSKKE